MLKYGYVCLFVAVVSGLFVVGCPTPPEGETPQPSLGWSYIPTANSIWGLNINSTQDGGYIVGGGNTGYNMYALKLTAAGAYDWDATYSRLTPDTNESELWRDQAHGIQQTADGGYIMLGRGHNWQDGLPEASYLLVKLTSTGAEDWSEALAPDNPFDTGHYTAVNWPAALQITNDGGFMVVGASYVGAYDLSTILKTDAEGNVDFLHVIDTDNDKEYQENILGGQQTSDGGYVLVGYSGESAPNALLIKVDDGGGWEWTQKYQDTVGGHGAEALAVTQTADDGYLLGGELINDVGKALTYGCWLAKVNSAGTVVWFQSYGHAATIHYPNVIKETPDGNFVAAGSNNAGYMTLAKFTAAGNLLWNFVMEDFGGKMIHDLVLTADGGCVVVGSGGTSGPTAIAKIENVFLP
jgi:hypothetical protein